MRRALAVACVAVAGVGAGAAHAVLLARSARGEATPASWLTRFVGLALILFLSARAGELLAGTAGWVAGLAVVGTIAYRGLPPRRLS